MKYPKSLQRQSVSFFLLEKTEKKIVLLEKNRLAQGATGHNAGQIVSYFERSFTSMSKEFGLEKTGDAWKAVDNAWNTLEYMYHKAELAMPISKFTGYAGLYGIR